jgi:hypothetical protein
MLATLISSLIFYFFLIFNTRFPTIPESGIDRDALGSATSHHRNIN